jgi:lysyl-tRNA synthetase class 2
MPIAFISELWNEQIVEQGREGVFLVFVGFLGSFLFIRTSTRLMRSPKVPWWPGSVSPGGLHIHHLVFGIVLMLIAPTVAYGVGDEAPWWELTALAFGIGAGLTFDEFALWLHLDDVYWAEEGRRSVDAVVIASVFIVIVFLGVVPFELDDSDWELFLVSLVGLLISIGTSAVCFLKRRIGHGVLGLFFYPLSLYGALRLAKPGSPWAKRFYGERNPKEQARSEKRFRHNRVERLYDSFRIALGGRPTESIEARQRETET